jgi:hypothetical protein
MHDAFIDNSLDIGFDWSALHAVPAHISQRSIRIQRDYFSRIEAVSRELRTVDLHEEDSFIGTVERLDGVMDASGCRSGDVILALLIPEEGETVKAKIQLSADAYKKADHAHMTSGGYVRVTGRLHPGRQPRQLTHVSRFELISSKTPANASP